MHTLMAISQCFVLAASIVFFAARKGFSHPPQRSCLCLCGVWEKDKQSTLVASYAIVEKATVTSKTLGNIKTG